MNKLIEKNFSITDLYKISIEFEFYVRNNYTHLKNTLYKKDTD